MSHPSSLEGIDRESLTPIVRRALGSDTAEVGNWQCVSIHKPFNQATGGVFRVSGTARDQGGETPWSVVLKAGGVGLLSDDPTSPQYWKREYLAYQSGFLASLPGGLKAPSCFGVEEVSDHEIRLWLEDIQDAHPGKWPPELYLQAARHLGRFSGAYLTTIPIPDHPWLSRGFLRRTLDFFAQFRVLYPGNEHHALVRLTYRDDTLGRVIRLFDARESLEKALERLPQTICHHDAFRRNLLVRKRGDDEEVVAVDWAFAGHGAVGEELGDLLPASVWSRDLTSAEAGDLLEAVFEAYLAGLRDSGWTGDSRLARLGYAAATALRWGLSLAPLAVTQERWYIYIAGLVEHSFGETVEEFLERMGQVLPLWLDLADEARSLLEIIPSLTASRERTG
jgi:hypothetical protein